MNDRQIRVSHTCLGEIIPINIDLTYANGEVMYLIASENDSEHSHKVQWKICAFMSAQSVSKTYGIKRDNLPKSSRNTNLENIGYHIYHTNIDQ